MHPGVAPGQLTDKPATGCVPGEQTVCGTWEGADEDRHFVSDQCPDD
jgi:hypothetical protein